MKITFNIEYKTQWGECLYAAYGNEYEHLLPLKTTDGLHWAGSVSIASTAGQKVLPYKYVIFTNDECTRKEIGYNSHKLCLTGDDNTHYIINDSWRDLPANNYLFSSALSNSGQNRPIEVEKAPKSTLLVRALAPGLDIKGKVLAICGGNKELGYWNEKKRLVMSQTVPNEWILPIEIHETTTEIEFKFVICDAKTGKVEEWEAGANRKLSIVDIVPEQVQVTPEYEVYIGDQHLKIAGTAIPIFSLRSEGSYGIGDFGDLKKLIDWAVYTHQKAVQILPINDTTITNTWTDSYPYNSISIYAFHPQYIDLRKLPALNDAKKAAQYEATRQELNSLTQIDYEAVNNNKRAYLHDVFEQCGEAELATEGFKKFFADNKHWLLPYAAFSYLRDQYGTPAFSEWPKYSIYKAAEIEKLCNPKSESYHAIAFYYYIQYQLHVQLLEVSNYAREKNIIFKGDIPIGISRNSVEAWVEPFYFNLNGQAGAPPDPFSANGQNWGFPTYNWDVMAQDNYQWWQRRFRKMSEYFTAYRIDHILGFFRIWEIPSHAVHGLLGQFSPALPMSEDEIRCFGLNFQKDFMTKPFINEDMLWRYFGDKAQFVKDTFLSHSHNDIWGMKPEFDTQRKVEAYFKGETDIEKLNMRDGIYALISNVLFVPDHKNPNMYHPRIAAQSDMLYPRLNQQEKDAFNRLYNHYFYQRHNEFWYHEAMKKLPVLTQATPMLVCGEDLGMVPDCVPWVMNQLQILSLEIERMPKNPHYEFGHVWEYPYLSVCTISTHDMSTLRGWWEEDECVTNSFYNGMLGRWGAAPRQASGDLCELMVNRHLCSPSMLCILSFQDWMSIDEDLRYPEAQAERINVPANPRHYWRYRMHLTLEDLMQKDEYNNKLRDLIDHSGRY